MRVVVLGGGRSCEHDVSRASAAAVTAGLRAGGHEVVEVEIARDGRWSVDGTPVVIEPAGGLLDADVVFPALHGPYGEDGVVQGLLECLGVPYVGSDVASSALCMDKVRFKALMGAAGIAQVDVRHVEYDELAVSNGVVDDLVEALGLPVFVKPARMGSSLGIGRATTAAELAAALEVAAGFDRRVIVEALARGQEVECSLLGDGDDVRVSPPGEVVVRGEFYDYAAKYEPGAMELIVPARISATAAATVTQIARDAFKLAGASGLARADFFVDGELVLLNELNTMPGFTPTSVYAALWEAGGIPYPALVAQLCEIALRRYEDVAR